jgi:NAD(P)-dependent dehydrogenase (short-subunit alcohol dehydrogenase family)
MASTDAAAVPAPPVGPGSLEGTTVVIFGGSSGIGLQVALSCARAGSHQIHIIGRTESKLATAKALILEAASADPASTPALVVNTASVDVTDEEKVRAHMNSNFKPDSIDHLVTTPGGSAKLGNLIANKRSCADVRRQMDMKFYAQLAPVLAAGDKIKPYGSITMVSGVLSRRVGRGNDALAIANSAIECAVKCLANDYGFDGRRVRVNAISPGMTLTPVYGGSDDIQSYQEKIAQSVPVQRNAIPEEQAHAVVFLMTNRFMTGHILDCDGGYLNRP